MEQENRKPENFTCPVCWSVSYNPNDIKHGYCGRCHDWTGDPAGLASPEGKTPHAKGDD